MKNLKKLKEAKELSKNEQKNLKGGKIDLCKIIRCVPEKKCIDGRCVSFM